jgi:hypothetical protein
MPSKPTPDGSQRFSINYVPNVPQEKFAAAIAGGARIVLFLGGIRSGKTVAGIAESLKQIYKYDAKPRLGWIVSPTYPMSLVPERIFRGMCISNSGSLVARERKGERAFEMRPTAKTNGDLYRVEFKTAEEPDRLRGASISWCMLDEAAMMDPEIFDIMQGRVMDNGGLIMLTTTPRGKNWLYDKVYLPSLNDPRYAVIKCRTQDNTYLPKEEADRLYKTYSAGSAQLAKREMDAEFTSLDGMVFDRFVPSTHTVDGGILGRPDEVFCGIDFGTNDPTVCVWVGRFGTRYVLLDEYYRSAGLMRDHAEYILNHPLSSQVRVYWADPSGKQERMEMAAAGLRTLPARRPKHSPKTSWPVMRARLMNQMFGTSVEWAQGQWAPMLTLSHNMRYGTHEFLNLAYERFSEITETGQIVYKHGGDIVQQNATEKLVDANNHVVDAAGYAIFSECRTTGGWEPHGVGLDGSPEAVGPTNQTPVERHLEEMRNALKIVEERRKKGNVQQPDIGGDPMRGLTE